MYLQECRPGYNRDTHIPMFIAAVFTIARLWKKPKYPTTEEWIKEMWYVYMDYYSATEKNETMTFSGNGYTQRSSC
jgi:hypothetical protein